MTDLIKEDQLAASPQSDHLEPREGANDQEWRCFHCDEVFTDAACASEHFGRFQDCDPICTVGAARYRDLEDQLASFRSESDAASKEFYALGAKHAGELRREEECGYAKGLRDAGYEAAALEDERTTIADKAREWAAHYPQSSDGRNTFVMFAEWVEARALGNAEVTGSACGAAPDASDKVPGSTK